MRSLKRMLLAWMAAMAILAVAGVATASATAPPLKTGTVPSERYATQDANVPYLAWRGEHVKLVGCDEVNFPEGSTATWMLEDPPNDPVFQPGLDFSSVNVAGNCAVGTWISQKAGVAFIKLIIRNAAGTDIFEKQFIVGWMELMKPQVIGGGDVNAADFCNKYTGLDAISADLVRRLGPFSNCWHDPQDPRHNIQILVKGKLPLENDFSEWGLGSSLTLPDDWGKWAAVAARSTADGDGVLAITNWDIHDDSATTEGHTITNPLGSQCPSDPKVEEIYKDFDAVDNCTGGGAWGGFSTVFGTQTRAGHTIGPWDPIYPYDTMLSDGKVDAGDAPMPAAQIDVTIKDNVAANKSDIGGVGYLVASDKTEVYSRDGKGVNTKNLAHDLYAPFYSQYIPPTARPVDAAGSPYGAAPASGIDGSGDPDGFGGFLVKGNHVYDNWDVAYTWAYHANAWSKCLYSQVLPGLADYYRPLPYGPSSVSVYTDESGEANINYVPGLGMYFDNLAKANKNLNNGCDLEGVDPIGTAEVDVVAKYPYQPITAQKVAADPVNFTVHNQFKKTLTTYSKGVDKNGITSNSVAKIVLAHAQDIDGSPLAYELVCWMANKNAEGFRVYAGDIPAPTMDDPNAVIHLDPWHALLTTYQDPWGMNRLCTFTDEWGNTAIEVYNSDRTSVNVIAEFVNEGLLRDTFADFAPASVGATTSADGPPVTHVPTQGQLNQAVAIGTVGPVVAAKAPVKTIKSVQAKTKKQVLHKIRFAKVVTPFKGQGKLQVRVNGKAGLVGLRITILKDGKSRVITRFIPANRLMTVKHLVIAPKTTKVTVKLIGI